MIKIGRRGLFVTVRVTCLSASLNPAPFETYSISPGVTVGTRAAYTVAVATELSQDGELQIATLWPRR